MDADLQKEIFGLAKTVIERLSSGPVVVLVFILLFRKQLEAVLKSVSEPLGRVVESLLSRGFKLGLNKEGLKLEADALIAVTAQEKLVITKGLTGGSETDKRLQTVQAESTVVATVLVDDPQAKRLQAVKNVDVLPIVLEQENLIREDLNKLGIEQHEQVELLVKHLAISQLLVRAESVYRTIFGSQIALLKLLNTQGGITKAKLLQFYETAKAQFPNLYNTYSFEQYVEYLRAQALIIEQPPEQYGITVAGKEFLKWMTQMSLLDNKPF